MDKIKIYIWKNHDVARLDISVHALQILVQFLDSKQKRGEEIFEGFFC